MHSRIVSSDFLKVPNRNGPSNANRCKSAQMASSMLYFKKQKITPETDKSSNTQSSVSLTRILFFVDHGQNFWKLSPENTTIAANTVTPLKAAC